ncbi:MAG: hypothetical protein ABEI31_01985 [Halodesulfurarchaeum sp.]
MGIEFARASQEATFYNPLEDFQETTIEVEVRTDPLTGRQTRLVPESFLMPEEEPDLTPVVEDDEGCFFCPEMVGDATPKYPDFVGVDRGAVGEATAFPNLNPYGQHSNVVVLTEDHYVPIDEFTPAIFRDGFQAALEYVHAVFDHDDAADVASLNMNYLRSAGSSIIHPHIQTLVDGRGTTAQRERFEAARAFYEDQGRDYWEALLEKDRAGPRHVGSTGSVEWLAPFAPRHHRHVLGILPSTDVPDPESTAVKELAAGLVNVLDYYANVGLNSFNVGFHLVRDDPSVRPVVDVVARSVFDEYYWSDATFFETIHDEAVIDVSPSQYADEAAAHF